MLLSLTDAATRIANARTPQDLFGTGDDAKKRYRELAAICHPDQYTDLSHHDVALEAMAKLTRLWAELTKAVSAKPIVLGNWVVTSPLAKGGLNDLYLARRAKDGSQAVLKIARHPRDNSLLKREAEYLSKLRTDTQGEAYHKYLPQVLDTFEASYRRANVVSIADGCCSLEQLKRMLGGGIDFRHVVWMMNRLLSLLGYIHHHGLMHGAVLPHHLLYRPADHGLVLVDWSCASTFDEAKVPYAVSRFKDLYPVEVLFSKGRCVPSTDIYMAFASLRWAAKEVPYRFRDFFSWCTLESLHSRPEHAWAVQDKWKRLAADEYGKPKFVALEVPIH